MYVPVTPKRLFERLGRGDPSLGVLLLGLALGVAGFFTLATMTAPIGDLLGESSYKFISAFHGVAAFVYLIMATLAAYLAWRLLTGQIKAFEDLKWLSTFSAMGSFFTIVFGNWIYIGYRAKGGPREVFLSTIPEVHKIFFEFKEFLALFTLPLTVAAAFSLWHYGDALIKDRRLRVGVAVLLILGWIAMVVTFSLGAAITKLREV